MGKVIDMDKWNNCCWSAVKHGWSECPVCGERLFFKEEVRVEEEIKPEETPIKHIQVIRMNKREYNKLIQRVH
ncbi:MAG: hypothetical protein IKZ49_01405 [Alphaproteobacteria bacterium]|nr:hypothetical protein [Alphaproteobacteria bacterium]